MSWKELFRRKNENPEMVVPLLDKDSINMPKKVDQDNEITVEIDSILEEVDSQEINEEEIGIEQNNKIDLSTQETIVEEYFDTVGEIKAYSEQSIVSNYQGANSNSSTVKRGIKLF